YDTGLTVMILASSFDLSDPTMWENRGLFYGDGIFETMRTIQGMIPLWDWHYRRLHNSLLWLKIKPPAAELLRDTICSQLPGDKSLVIRLTLFRAQQNRGYQPLTDRCHWLVTASEFKPQEQPKILAVADARLSPLSLLNNHTHVTSSPQVLLSEPLIHMTALDDLLVLDTQQRVIETSRQNLLLLKDNQLRSPALHDGGVNGVAIIWLRH